VTAEDGDDLHAQVTVRQFERRDQVVAALSDILRARLGVAVMEGPRPGDTCAMLRAVLPCRWHVRG